MMPVIITAQAVSSGIPPIVFEISTAIGVVTDFGRREIIKDNFVWKNLPKKAVETSAINVAKIKPNQIARLFSSRTSLFLIKGYARAIVAGPRRYVTYFAPELYSLKSMLKNFNNKIIKTAEETIGGSFFKRRKRQKN